MCSSNTFVPPHPAGAAGIPTDCTQMGVGVRPILDKLIAFAPAVVAQRLLSLTLLSNLLSAGARTPIAWLGGVLLATHPGALLDFRRHFS